MRDILNPMVSFQIQIFASKFRGETNETAINMLIEYLNCNLGRNFGPYREEIAEEFREIYQKN